MIRVDIEKINAEFVNDYEAKKAFIERELEEVRVGLDEYIKTLPAYQEAEKEFLDKCIKLKEDTLNKVVEKHRPVLAVYEKFTFVNEVNEAVDAEIVE